jgi:hypothetical protein
MRAHLIVFALVGTALVACSGTPASPPDGGGDGSTVGDGGCIAPTEGASCSSNDVACQPPGDVCCVGYAWMCQNGAWTKAGVGCACYVGQPFACGGSTSCNSKSQYCVDQAPGVALPDGGVPPDSYSCDSMPAECASFPTCACVTAHNPCPTALAGCDESNGEVTVHCMGQ